MGIKRTNLMILTIVTLIFLISGCGNKLTMEQKYLKNNYANINLDKPLEFNLIKNELTNKEIFLSGEFHRIYPNKKLELGLIKYLKEKGVHFITPSELEDYIKYEIRLPPKSALVTFDDVDVSVYNTAFPILKKHEIPFTLFMITGQIGNKDFNGLKLSTTSEIKEMVDSGLATVGSHTHNLHYFSNDGNPVFMNPKKHEDFIEDAKLSIKTLEQNFKCNGRYFSYPYGYGTPETDEILLDLDFGLIFSLRPDIVKPGDPSFFTKRVLVTQETWKDIVKWIE